MNKILLFIMLITMTVVPMLFTTDVMKVENGKRYITFKEKNRLFAFTGNVNESLKDNFIESVILNPTNVHYVFIDSPGGSVHSLLAMVDFMKASKRHYVCVARFAASAAFIFLQHCNERYIMPNGTLMSHEASGRLAGTVAQMQTSLDLWKAQLKRLNSHVASRLKMTYGLYIQLIKDELWMDRISAKKFNAIDGVSYVNCSINLLKERITVSETVCSLFGCKEVTRTISACPILNKTYNK